MTSNHFHLLLYRPTKADIFSDTRILPKITNLIDENDFLEKVIMVFLHQMLYGPTKANDFLDTKILPKITNLINENGF